MASASPAMNPARPSGLVDFRKHAEYPILLGDSLKEDDSLANQLVDLRFNWQPKSGLKDFENTLSNGDDGYSLNVNDATTHESAYRYAGHERNTGDSMSSFALIFDKNKSAFILESIAHSVDLNLESAASQSKDDVRRRTKLPRETQRQSVSGNKRGVDDDEADPSNPFDFRNYLDDAKDTIEKNATGNRSPMPGSRTPMSGFASPVAPPTRFTTANTSALPPKAARAPARKPKPDTQPARKPKPAQDRKPARQMPLSNERISDSDDELSDSLTISQPQPQPQSHSQTQLSKASSTPSATNSQHTKGHSRAPSGNIGRSPHIVVNDGDLEIDMGSPPPESRARKRRIDAEVFRSHTGTPVLGNSPRAGPAAAVASSSSASRGRDRHGGDVEMKDASDAEAEHDNDQGGEEEDGDVDVLDLGSPQAKNAPQRGRERERERAQQRQQEQEQEHSRAPPTPPNAPGAANDEDDGVAELEDLLGGDDDMDTSGGAGLGLGIMADEDSEVSEEE